MKSIRQTWSPILLSKRPAGSAARAGVRKRAAAPLDEQCAEAA